MPSSTRGFTLLEVMIVIAIAGVITAMAAPSLSRLYNRMALSSEGRRLYGAVMEGQGLATSSGHKIQLLVDRANGKWELREDVDGDNVFERLVREHPKGTDRWPTNVALGPAVGTTAAFPVPFNTIAHNKWCIPASICPATVAEIRFDADGRITDGSDVVLNGGALMLHDPTATSSKLVEALVWVGATGSVRLFAMVE